MYRKERGKINHQDDIVVMASPGALDHFSLRPHRKMQQME
jgi:hypothetical protein